MQNRMTSGNPMSLILKFTIPLLLGNIFQQLYNLCDTVLVGKFVGKDALAAVGSTGTVVFLLMGFTNGMVTGFTILTSQRYGAKDDDGTKKTVSTGFILCIAMIAIVTTISLLTVKNLLILMKTPTDIFDNAYKYLSIICMGIFATVFNNYFSSLVRAIGNSKAPLCFLLFSASLNVILDLLFIVKFGYGVAGAAWATVISQASSAVLCFCYIMFKVPSLRPSRKHLKLDGKIAKTQVILGIPMALQFGITASGTIVMQSAINRFGSTAVAAFTAAQKTQGILNQGMFTIGQTMAAYVGQNYGSRDMKRIRQGIIASLKIFAIYSVVSAVLIITFLKPTLTIFFEKGTDITPFLPYARTYILESASCYMFLAMIFIYRNSMQAVGHGVAAMVMGISELVARLITSFISIQMHSYWLAVASDPLAWAAAGILGIFLCRGVLKKVEAKWELNPQTV
ncbi:MAG: MATE family efflux transporter [Saccharofermentans sp.]|nr:MATE family efflux transporter [Saccharofermentans sp.]